MSTHRLALRLPRVREPSLTQDTPGATSQIGRSAANLSVTLGCGMGRSSHPTLNVVAIRRDGHVVVFSSLRHTSSNWCFGQLPPWTVLLTHRGAPRRMTPCPAVPCLSMSVRYGLVTVIWPVSDIAPLTL